MGNRKYAAGAIPFFKDYPDFLKIITAKFFSIMCGRMMFTLMGWEVYKITKDPLSIGFLGLFEVIPAILFALFAGNIIDIYPRKKIVVTVAVANTFILSVLTVCLFLIEEHQWVYLFYGFSFMVGVGRSFWGSTLSTLIPTIVPSHQLPTAGPYNTGAFLFGSIVGHALGGLLIAFFSTPHIGIVGIGMFGVCVLLMCSLPDFPKASQKRANTLQNIQEGVLYVYRHKAIFSALLLDLVAVLFGGVSALIPIYAKDILFISPKLFGVLNAAMDVGAGIGIVTLSLFPMKHHHGKKMIFSIVGFGICIILFGCSRNVVLSFALLAVAGFCDSMSMVVRGIILQSYVPNYIRGRVMSVNSIFVASSNELGQFESGLVSKMIGVIATTIVGGAITITSAVVAYVYAPSLRALDWNKKEKHV